MDEHDDRPTINRQHWLNLNVNGGVYIDDAEDRTNYLLNEWERMGGEIEHLRAELRRAHAAAALTC